MFVHIHYEKGPEVLKDTSIEVSNKVISLINEGLSDSAISQEIEVSEDVSLAIRSIYTNKLRRCCFCGIIFDPKGTKASTCGSEHYLPCIDCGVPLKVKESYNEYMKAGGRRCPACRANQIGATRRNKPKEEKDAIIAKQQSTMIERYGAATPLQVPEIKSKIQATIKDKYGVDNLSQSAEIQKKIHDNSMSKYGVAHYSNAPEIRQRMKEGMVSKYGVEYAQQNPEIQAKTKATNIIKYGCENVFQNEDVRKTYVDRHRAKYNVSWPHQRADLIDKVKKSNLIKYGAVMYPISDEFLRNYISDPSKFDKYKEFISDPELFISANYVDKPSVSQICSDIGVTDTTVYDRLISLGLRDLATTNEYSMETELIDFIRKLDATIQIEVHNRSILEGKEIDVYLPEYKIGFECNPTWTHNSSCSDPWGNPCKHYKYHADKSKLAQSKGVFIYHIFGYEWTHRKDAIKSQIINLLGCNHDKVYARNTEVVEVLSLDALEFLDNNHRQGRAQASVRLGLVVKGTSDIVSLMTFGKMRPGIGKKSNQSANEWELIRFCNKRDTSVVGGASKLFKHFVDCYKPDKVVSFSDIAHTRGQLYSVLGFNNVSTSDPGYVWVNLDADDYYNRVSCQKKNLVHLFDDVTQSDIETKTEPEIMIEHGFVQVFDSGVIRWEWTNNDVDVNDKQQM